MFPCLSICMCWGGGCNGASRQIRVLKSAGGGWGRGGRVWYVDRAGNRKPAVVEDLDTTHPPPSYTIRLEGASSTRSTEADRLTLREEGVPAPAMRCCGHVCKHAQA